MSGSLSSGNVNVMMAFFKKEIPRTPIYLANGDRIVFQTSDHVTGFYQTDDPVKIETLRQLQKEHRGGVTEITQADYEDGKKKAGSIASEKPWREEISVGVVPDTIHQPTAPAAVAPAEVKPPETPASEPLPKKAMRPPNVGRRPAV